MTTHGIVSAGASGEELAESMTKGHESARPSGWDPVLRIADQELDGIDAEVLYPSFAMTLFTMTDAELQRACFSAYNGWVAEFCAPSSRGSEARRSGPPPRSPRRRAGSTRRRAR